MLQIVLDIFATEVTNSVESKKINPADKLIYKQILGIKLKLMIQ